ncbi:MAG TPA: hypothetical protein IGS53_25175 [Leptolyngbyaceae cyanobacterium M33_DOE_097]|uniref:Uncharacterized protein n=1 Tax=Oscillatoriales cyanobacterium SpSt-418 TaxID=2282169 RepID=A0A7C3KCJ1_9CYAN|nr:hypothetical protein [Leptolyngbyaceae cyanobacterium M33_DOE_097]
MVRKIIALLAALLTSFATVATPVSAQPEPRFNSPHESELIQPTENFPAPPKPSIPDIKEGREHTIYYVKPKSVKNVILTLREHGIRGGAIEFPDPNKSRRKTSDQTSTKS